ncbi:MAG TPA: hypothetical protein VFH30_15000 [Acidimicrobiales bacterium]|nr:hypothetical protein [Acidimicrobiales bacterium]
MRRTISPNLETALERAAPTRTQWDAWTSHEPALGGLTYEDLRVELRTGTRQRQDELLAALVDVTNRHPTAFNVLAACLLPAIRHRIFRYAQRLERQDAMAIMVDALHEAIGRYDIDEPPRFVAQRLLDLPTHRLRHAVAVCRAWSSCVECRAEDLALASTPDLSASTLLATAVHAGVLGEHDARLIYETRIAGRPLREVATRLGLGYEGARKRRRRAEVSWAGWWAPERCQQESRP